MSLPLAVTTTQTMGKAHNKGQKSYKKGQKAHKKEQKRDTTNGSNDHT